MATQNSEWKSKYQTSIRELDKKEQEWSQVENILRKAISRLSLAARGLDDKLDEQLKLIQTLSREKRDERLSSALNQLSSIISSLDQSGKESSGQFPESMSLLMETLQEIDLNKDQQQRLKPMCAKLLKAIASGSKSNGEKQQVSEQLKQISALVNENLSGSQTGDTADNLLTQLISLLQVTPDVSVKIKAILKNNRQLQEQELQALADTLNGALQANGDGKLSIDVTINELLDQLSSVQGMADTVSELRARVDNGLQQEEWKDAISQIVDAVNAALNQLDLEKRELEGFIVNITKQLGQLSQLVEEDFQEKTDEHNHARDFHDYLHEGINSIEADFQSSNNLQELRESISKNIQFIRQRVDTFVHETHERFEATEKRNQQLSSQLSEMEQETEALQVKLAENREKLMRDPLTGVFNRLAYDQQLTQDMARWERYQTPFSFAILDIDFFKRINDDYGHAAGDKALVIVAKLMMKMVRKTDLIFRIGGEEFVIIMPATDQQAAGQLIDKIRQAVSQTEIHFKQKRVNLTLSAGYTAAREGDNEDKIFERTDKAMYRAKNSGRNCQFEAA